MSRYNPRRKNPKPSPYYGSRAFDATCRCHGSCPYCQGNRLYQARKIAQAAECDMALYGVGK